MNCELRIDENRKYQTYRYEIWVMGNDYRLYAADSLTLIVEWIVDHSDTHNVIKTVQARKDNLK